MSRRKGAPERAGAAQAKALLAVAGCRLPYAATVAGPVLVVQYPIIPASAAMSA